MAEASGICPSCRSIRSRMGIKMLVKAVVSEKYKETEVHVCKDRIDGEVRDLLEEISGYVNQELLVQAENGDCTVLYQKDVISFYSAEQKIFARTSEGTYTIPKKLYELESELDEKQFIRISKSEIINLKKIKKLDLSLTGTIRVLLKDGSETYTSRRNVVKLKQAFGI